MNEKYLLINSDVFAGLNSLSDSSIDVAITSPPYWNQRDYGFNNQIGSEATYQEYIDKLTSIFILLKAKLKNNGVFFLNTGDKYLSKYGKSPLAFIPYKLVNSMILTGWILNDIIVWYKPNHMPSSIKNRFANSYEPIFVLSPSDDSIYNNANNFSNIVKINLQPTLYKHVAVFPEKLVLNLLSKLKLKNNFAVLDPFAGSGTTLKVIKDNFPFANACMIEFNDDYIDIIKQRCKLEKNYIERAYNFIPYEIISSKKIEDETLELFDKYSEYNTSKQQQGLIEITNNKSEYFNLLSKFENHLIKNRIMNNGLCFIGSRQFDIDLFIRTSALNNKGWIIRNILIAHNNVKWFPIFMIVDDNKRSDYVFNYQNLKLKTKSEYNRDWSVTDFIGFLVTDTVHKNKKNGIVIKIVEYYENKFPRIVVVKWNDGKFTKEFVAQDQNEIDSYIVQKYISYIKIKEMSGINAFHEFIESFDIDDKKINNSRKKNNYNGKYKEESRKNWGASPGARSSLENEYFSLQRLYTVDQKLIADYLNIERVEKGYSKTEFTNLFPPSYKHTVGHWLRKDFGGSIPTPEDWELISHFLDIDESFTKYATRTALKLQTVQHSDFKMPDDFFEETFIRKLKRLFSTK
ncbi:MAG: site-specific DNA-methyltransferase [Bacteroidota bacterium]